jgi:hypothetical protein
MAGESSGLAVVHAIRPGLRRAAAHPSTRRPAWGTPPTRWWNSPRHSLYNAVVLRSRRSAAARPLSGLSRARMWQLLVFLLVLAPALALAAPPPAPASGSSAKSAKAPATTTTNPGGKKVISLDDEFLVEGQLEKPSAFYVLRRSSTDYDWARLDATMTPLVLESVWDPLF